jgi:hypothetical protein
LNKGGVYNLSERLWKESRSEKNTWATGDFKRLRMRRAPGQEKRFTKKDNNRIRNRSQVSFFCRYVLNQKGIEIPLK